MHSLVLSLVLFPFGMSVRSWFGMIDTNTTLLNPQSNSSAFYGPTHLDSTPSSSLASFGIAFTCSIVSYMTSRRDPLWSDVGINDVIGGF